MPWWGHVIAVTLTLAGITATVLTGVPWYAAGAAVVAFAALRLHRASGTRPQRERLLDLAAAPVAQWVTHNGREFLLVQDGNRTRVVSL